jgi:hypothetical protein
MALVIRQRIAATLIPTFFQGAAPQGSRNQEGPPRRAALNCSPQETGDQSSEIDARAGIEEVESVQRHGSMMETTVDQVELG